jgi:antitoxin component of MazEF toxin-antitoxin module
MDIESRIARYGKSLTVRIPVAVARHLDLRAGDTVVLRMVDDGLFIERAATFRLAARLATVRATVAEAGAGRAVGAEQFV